MDVQEIMRSLGLMPHPTCGFIAETYRAKCRVPGQELPPGYGGTRPLGSALYFLVTPDARMVLHRIRADQIYHHYRGDPLEVLLLYPDRRGEVAVMGPDLSRGERPQLLIPGGTFHVSRVAQGGRYALLGTTAWPGVEAPDVEFPDLDRLVLEYPALAASIRAFARFAPPTEPLSDFR